MNEDTQKIVVVQSEHFKALPEATQELITSLSTELNVQSLNTLNPLVEAMATLEGFTKLKYVEGDEASIQSYKDAKKATGSFNQSTKKAKAALKKPYLETGRKIDSIEKAFLKRSKEIAELLAEEFKSYLDEQARIKKEKEDKKNKDILDKVKDLNEQTVEQSLIIQRNKIYQRYVDANQTMLNTVMSQIDTYSQEALTDLKSSFFEPLEIAQEDQNILLEDQVVNLRASYKAMCESAVRMIEAKLQEFEKHALQPNPEPTQIEVVEEEEVQGLSFQNRFSFLMQELIEKIEKINTVSDIEEKAKQAAIRGLGNYSLKISAYIDENNS